MDLYVSVRQVLQTDAFLNSQVIAGRSGLDRHITRITVSELPDALDWINGGELVCSTGYQLKDSPQTQLEWITRMEQLGVAALIIKPHRFISEVPQLMIDTANQVGFPLIELPNDIIWPTVIQSVMDLMLSIQTKRLQESYDTHNRLVRLVLASSGLDSILRTISQISSCAVILEDRYFNTLGTYKSHDPIAAECSAVRLSNKQKAALREKLSSEPPEGFYSAQSAALFINEKIGSVTQLLIPVVAGKFFFGWLTLLPVEEENRVLAETVIMHGATATALELLIQVTGIQSRAYEMNNFFDLILSGSGVSPEQFKRQSVLVGVDLSSPVSAFFIRPKSEFTLFSFHQIEDIVKKADPFSVASYSNSQIIILMHPKNSFDEKAATAECHRVATKILEATKRDETTCCVGIGKCVSPTQPDNLKNSLQEARECASKAEKKNLDICTYEQLGMERLFPMFSSMAEVVSFSKRTLSPLLDFDRERNAEMVKTLAVYLENGFNKTQSARELCVHINTLNYRLAKIQEVMDVDLGDIETCMMLVLATKMLDEQTLI